MPMPRPGVRAARRRGVGAAALTAGAAILLAVTGCTSSGPTTTTPPDTSASSTPPSPAAGNGQDAGPIVPTASTLHWHSCPAQLAHMGIPDCTTLSVPLNYSDPGGRHITLALDMVPATAPRSQQQGIMLVNPGGPGSSGLPWA